MGFSRPQLGVASAIAGGMAFLAAGGEDHWASSDGAALITLPSVLLATLGIAALGLAAQLLGWIHVPPDEPDNPKNAHVHGAARPASEVETQAAARGVVTPQPAHEAKFLD